MRVSATALLFLAGGASDVATATGVAAASPMAMLSSDTALSSKRREHDAVDAAAATADATADAFANANADAAVSTAANATGGAHATGGTGAHGGSSDDAFVGINLSTLYISSSKAQTPEQATCLITGETGCTHVKVGECGERARVSGAGVRTRVWVAISVGRPD
jgi:hypothetical protein